MTRSRVPNSSFQLCHNGTQYNTMGSFYFRKFNSWDLIMMVLRLYPFYLSFDFKLYSYTERLGKSLDFIMSIALDILLNICIVKLKLDNLADLGSYWLLFWPNIHIGLRNLFSVSRDLYALRYCHRLDSITIHNLNCI